MRSVQTGWFSLTGELKQAIVASTRERERWRKGVKEKRDFPKTTVWSLSVLTVQLLPPRIKGREVAWLSAALSHVKPRWRPYTCSHK